MRFAPPRVNGAKKAVWGRSILFAVLAALLLSASPADAAAKKTPAEVTAAAAAKKAQRTARIARRHAKLDIKLNDAVEDAANGESAVIIEFNDNADDLTLVKNAGGKPGRKLGILKARVAKLPNKQLKALANNKKVKRISKDREVEGFVGRTAVAMGARAVQELMGYSGAGVGVAIIDSGVSGWHDDLTNANGQGQRVTQFVDFVNGRTQAYDDWGHGTHVAGIVAGNGTDTNGTRKSIAPDATVIALKALDAQGHGTISNIIAALDWAVANKNALNIRVINMSLGAGVYESYNTDPLTLAAKRAVEAGIVVVAAAGNLGHAANGMPQYGAISAPGNAPWVLTVGASSTNGTVLRQDDTIANYSSRGPTMYDYAAKPDLVAPGSGTISLADPLSTFFTTKPQFLLAGQLATSYTPYLVLSGTSMSAPAVAGTVALMLQANPDLTPNLVKAILQYTAQVYPGYNYLTQGAGFANARGAVQLAEFFNHAQPGAAWPNMRGWSRHIFWGNKRVSGGVLMPGGNAWDTHVLWGAAGTSGGDNIVWGNNCSDAACDNIVWGNSDDDNIVWGNSDGDNIVWGNSDHDNIVWGNDCGGDDCHVVWGRSDGDNIVWGNSDDDNIVWGNSDDDNIVWGNSADDDNIVWGNSAALVNVVFDDETKQVNSLPSSLWDAVFPLDADLSVLNPPAPPAPVDDLLPAPVETLTESIAPVAEAVAQQPVATVTEPAATVTLPVQTVTEPVAAVTQPVPTTAPVTTLLSPAPAPAPATTTPTTTIISAPILLGGLF